MKVCLPMCPNVPAYERHEHDSVMRRCKNVSPGDPLGVIGAFTQRRTQKAPIGLPGTFL